MMIQFFPRVASPQVGDAREAMFGSTLNSALQPTALDASEKMSVRRQLGGDGDIDC